MRRSCPPFPKTLLLGLLTALLAALFTSPSAASGTAPFVSPQDDDVEVTYDGLARDAAIAAAERGVDAKTMEQYLLQEQEFSAAASAIEVAAGHRFAGAWLEPRPEPHLIVGVTGTGSIRALEVLLEPFGARAEVRYGQRHSLRSLVAETEKLTSPGKRGTVRAEFTARVDVPRNRVEVDLYGITAQTRREARTSIDEALSTLSVSSAVAEHSEDPPQFENRGGRLLDICTSGFAVRDNDSTRRGFLTAGHCTHWGPVRVYYWWSNMSTRPVTKEDWFDTLSRDVAWYSVHPSVQAVEPLFHESRTLARPQRGTYVPMIGGTVCHWGAHSEDSGCASVVSFNSAPSGHGPYFVEVRGTSFQTCAGDSGGPWHVGDLAVGTHVAGGPHVTQKADPIDGHLIDCSAPSGGSSHSGYYEPIAIGLSTLGVSLLISP